MSSNGKHYRRITVASLLAAFAWLVGHAAPPVIPAVTDCLNAYVKKGELSGAVALVIHDGKIVHFDACGEADLASTWPAIVVAG